MAEDIKRTFKTDNVLAKTRRRTNAKNTKDRATQILQKMLMNNYSLHVYDRDACTFETGRYTNNNKAINLTSDFL